MSHVFTLVGPLAIFLIPAIVILPFPLVIAVIALPAPAEAARTPARIGRAFYEVQRQAIIVPFEGTPPNAHHFELSGSHHYFELTGARLVDGSVQHQPIGGALKRYTLAARGPAVVRIAYELAFDAQPTIRLDAAAHRFEIFPFGQELHSAEPAVRVPRALALPTPAPRPRPAPVRAAVARPRPLAPVKLPTLLFKPRVPHNLSLPTPHPATALYRPSQGEVGLVVPFRGTAPGYDAKVFIANPRWLYFEFEGAGLTLEGQRFGVLEDPTIEAWMFTQPTPTKTRLYLRLRKPAPVVCEVRDADGELRFYSPADAHMVPPPAPSAVPSAGPTPAPTAAPATTAPVTPGPAASEPVPAPAAPRSPTEPSDPADGNAPMLYPRPDSAD